MQNTPELSHTMAATETASHPIIRYSRSGNNCDYVCDHCYNDCDRWGKFHVGAHQCTGCFQSRITSWKYKVCIGCDELSERVESCPVNEDEYESWECHSCLTGVTDDLTRRERCCDECSEAFLVPNSGSRARGICPSCIKRMLASGTARVCQAPGCEKVSLDASKEFCEDCADQHYGEEKLPEERRA